MPVNKQKGVMTLAFNLCLVVCLARDPLSTVCGSILTCPHLATHISSVVPKLVKHQPQRVHRLCSFAPYKCVDNKSSKKNVLDAIPPLEWKVVCACGIVVAH